MSAFQELAQWRPAANTAIGISERCKADSDPRKVDLSVGAYRDEDGKPVVLEVVREAACRVVADPLTNMEYLGHGGSALFCRLAADLLFGAGSPVLAAGRLASVHGVSGTGSLWVAACFLVQCYRPEAGPGQGAEGSRVALLSSPSWPLHDMMMARNGLVVLRYRYYDPLAKALDYEGLLEDLQAAPDRSILVLQAGGHNPTGVDPTPEQWRGILAAAQQKRFVVLMDIAYQGFVADLEADAAPVRLFAEAEGVELLVAQSFSKSMGLYSERVGALHFVAADPEVARGAQLALEQVVVPMYASPPKWGSAVATTILSDPALRRQWQDELAAMPASILRRRQGLYDALKAAGAPGSWEHIVRQRGMFSYTGLTQTQCQHLTDRWHVYLTSDGRISLTGLPLSRCRYVADAIKDALDRCPA